MPPSDRPPSDRPPSDRPPSDRVDSEAPPGQVLGDLEHAVATVLGPEGTLARGMGHYEDRPTQRRMAEAVAHALADNRVLVVEAGTGTGKTLGYLVPALLSGKRVVVSTGTRTLQDQITRHDLPLLRRLIERPFTAVTLKGVSNYLCRRKLHELTSRGSLAHQNLDRRALDVIRDWADHTDTGDRAELADLADDAPVWAALSNTPDTRIGPRCPFYDRCFVTQARRRAEKAELILVNHHLFFADLALRAAYPGARVLPEYDAVIFDEAHQLEDVITEHFGIRVSTIRLSQLAKDARDTLVGGGLFRPRRESLATDRIVAHVERCAASFFAQMRHVIMPHVTEESGRVELPTDLFGEEARQDAWFALDNALDELSLHTESEAQETLEAGDEERAEELFAVARRARLVRDDLAALAEQSADAFVYWGELRGPAVLLCGAPIDVAPYMQKHVIETVPAAVLTSATLTTGGTFDYVQQRLGLDDESADTLVVESPFDYPRQVMLYVPQDMPEPRAPEWAQAAWERIEALVRITEGRAFVLFTSHRMLRDTARRLARTLPYPLLIQGQKPRARLLEEFRGNPGSVLLGTGSFWEGVDVPGDALSLVIIDKLPFAPPVDPLVAARMRVLEGAHRDPFAEYQVPQAALTLKQGFGRLIRRRDDRGVVAILDRRVVGRMYGRTFLDTLPAGVPRTSAIEQVRRWWAGGVVEGVKAAGVEGAKAAGVEGAKAAGVEGAKAGSVVKGARAAVVADEAGAGGSGREVGTP